MTNKPSNQIPKRVERLLDRRRRLAQDLISVNSELDAYCESIGIDPGDPEACLLSDVRIYCEPSSAYSSTRKAIELALAAKY